MNKIWYQTYNEWKLDLRHVRKGEKARIFNEQGMALFGSDQVDKDIIHSPGDDPSDYAEYDMPGWDRDGIYN